jgi:hypothetical protein
MQPTSPSVSAASPHQVGWAFVAFLAAVLTAPRGVAASVLAEYIRPTRLVPSTKGGRRGRRAFVHPGRGQASLSFDVYSLGM